MRRIALTSPSLLLLTAQPPSSSPAPAPTTPTPTGSSSTTPSAWSPAPRCGSPASSPAPSPASTSTRRSRPWSTIEVTGPLSTVPRSATCSSRAAVADRRVLPRLPAGQTREPAARRRPDPGPQRRVRRQTFTTVQNDLVHNTLREPFKQRLALIFNEFGTALAGNPDEPQRGDPPRRAGAADAARGAGDPRPPERGSIRDLNVNSDRIISRLADRRDGRDPLHRERQRGLAGLGRAPRRPRRRTSDLLPGFLAELRPTLAPPRRPRRRADAAARRPRRDLRPALPPDRRRCRASTTPRCPRSRRSATRRGSGGRALAKGGRRDHGAAPVDQATRSPPPTEIANFLLDLDDPSRAVEIDAAPPATPAGRRRPATPASRASLNYAYYQTLAINQFDRSATCSTSSSSSSRTGPCGHYNAEHEFRRPDGRRATTSAAEREPLRHPGWARTSRRSTAARRRRPTTRRLPRRLRPTSSSATRRAQRSVASTETVGRDEAGAADGGARAPPASPARPDAAGTRCPTSPAPAAARAAADPRASIRATWTTCSGSAAAADNRSSAALGGGRPNGERRRQPATSSTTSSAADGARTTSRAPRHEAEPRAEPRRLAGDGRGDHDAGRDRRRLPRLQRLQRAPLRARLPDLGRAAQRAAAAAQQRGADRRPPGRGHRVDRAGGEPRLGPERRTAGDREGRT